MSVNLFVIGINPDSKLNIFKRCIYFENFNFLFIILFISFSRCFCHFFK